jgi:hypothetical protein
MKRYILTLICLLLLAGIVQADIRVVLDTPQVTFKNVTGSQFQYYLGIENKNSFPINITITLPSDLQITLDSPLTFELQEN